VKFGNEKDRADVIKTKNKFRRRYWVMLSAVVGLAVLWDLAALDYDTAIADDSLAEQIKGMNPRQQMQFLLAEHEAGRDDPELHFFMGVAMYSLGELDSAMVFFSNAVSKDSTYTKAYVNLAIVMESMRKMAEAEQLYQRAIALDPEDELALCHLGYLYYSQKKYDRAMDYYQQALVINPNSAQAHYNLGLAFADAKIFKEAITEWEKVVELDPDGELGKTAAENVRLIKQYLEVDSP
jgi:tetratricopeptide (TPR) repeat protein